MTNPPNNPISAATIEAIVREVLARIAPQAGVGAASDAHSKAAHQFSALPAATRLDDANAGRSAQASASDLVVAARVVTVDELAGRLDNRETVVVSPRAVITPAARDLLKERRIRLVRAAEPAKTAKQSNGACRLVIGCCDAASHAEPLIAWLAALGIEAENVPNGVLNVVVSELTDRLRDVRTKGVLITARAAAGACLANRDHRVRAAHIRTRDDLRAANDEIGVNLAVLHPNEMPLVALRQIVREYAVAPPTGSSREKIGIGSR